ncbi:MULTISPECIES: hypothetical protein [Vibrio]|uniref:hypothetical protein n=1 Tax=Vibrio TaxID=662 RepID=UPI0002F2DED9|nr:hypothetical protein [Vibrio tasmaniensis]OEF80717.1 hypothetical protein A162_14235 [Vibrio tasmaniensis 1F-155]PMO84319.1 hypothetical protein BCT01_04960 [Vibrio tasmaniensis]
MTNSSFRLLPLAVALATSFAAHATDEQKLAELENKVAILEAKELNSVADKFNFNGFASLNMQLGNHSHGFMKSENKVRFEEGSLIGLQGEFEVNESTSAVVQMVARGTKKENWTPDVEWAFLSHKVTPNLTLRGGKLRLPLFMYSDYLEVGYAQTSVRVPSEVYGPVVLTSLTGGDFIYDIELEDSTASFQGFVGAQKLSASKHTYSADTQFDDIVGGVINWTDDTWTLRAVYAQATVSSSTNWILDNDPLNLGNSYEMQNTKFNDEKAKFYGIGGRYDNGNLALVSEVTRTTVEGFYQDVDAAYLTVSYRVNEFTPYVTAAHMETTDDAERNGQVKSTGMKALLGTGSPNDYKSAKYVASGLNVQRTTYSIGTRWDFMPNIALKGDVSYLTNFGSTNGGVNASYKNEDNILYTVKVDAVF